MADDRGRRRPRVAGHRRLGTPPVATEPVEQLPLEQTTRETTAALPAEPHGEEPEPSAVDALETAAATPADPIEALRPSTPEGMPAEPVSAEPGPGDASLTSPPFHGETWHDPVPPRADESEPGAVPEHEPAVTPEVAAASEAAANPETAAPTAPGPATSVVPDGHTDRDTDGDTDRDTHGDTDQDTDVTATPDAAPSAVAAAAAGAAATTGHRGRRRRGSRPPGGTEKAQQSASTSKHTAQAAIGGPPRRQRALGVVVAALLVAVVAVAVIDLVRFDRSRAAVPVNDSATKSAVSAAVNAAGPLSSYDYRTTATAKVSKVRSLVTASCATSYQKILQTLSPTLDPLKSIETVAIMSGGVATTAKDSVSVLVFGERTSKDARLTTARVEGLQLTLTMVRQQGRWLVSAVAQAGSGGANATSC